MQALGTIASSTNRAYKSLLLHINQQLFRRCCNFSFVSNRNDLFGAYLRARTFRALYCEGNRSVKVTVYYLLKLTAIFRGEGLVSEASHWTRKPIYIATREVRRRGEVLLRQKNGHHKAIERKSTARYEIQNCEMPVESKGASKVLTILPESIRTFAAGRSS